MNDYLMEMELSVGDNLSDEEIMLMVANNRLRINRRKKYQKENDLYGEESDYYIYR